MQSKSAIFYSYPFQSSRISTERLDSLPDACGGSSRLLTGDILRDWEG